MNVPSRSTWYEPRHSLYRLLEIFSPLLHSTVTTPQRDTNAASFRILSWESLAGLLVGGVTASLLSGVGQPLLGLG